MKHWSFHINLYMSRSIRNYFVDLFLGPMEHCIQLTKMKPHIFVKLVEDLVYNMFELYGKITQ